MADNFNRWYKRKFEKLSGDPSDDIWENIANTLDKENDRRRRRGFFIRIFSLAGLLFIGSIIAVNYRFNSEKETLAYNKTAKENLQNVSITNSVDEKVKSPDYLNNAFTPGDYRSKSIESSKDENISYKKNEIPSENSEDIKISYQNLKNTSITDKSLNKTLAFNSDHVNILEVNESNKRTASKKENDIKKSDDEEILNNNLAIINRSSENLVATSDADTSINTYSDVNLSTTFSINNSKAYSENSFITDSNYLFLNTANQSKEIANKIVPSVEEDSVNANNEKKDTTIVFSETSENDSTLSKKSNDKIPAGLYVGSTYILNNVWLMNHDTYNGLKSSELNRTQISFGSAYGIVVGYNLSDRFSIQAEWLMNINEGQKYYIYTEGVQYTKRLRLDYTQANLLIKRKSMCFNSNGGLKGTWNKIAGTYIGYLKSATEHTDFYESDIKENYNTFNYGIILGLEYEAYINDRWMISSGLITNIGLKNIYKGTFKEPGDFNKTSVFNLGINFGLKYLISSN